MDYPDINALFQGYLDVFSSVTLVGNSYPVLAAVFCQVIELEIAVVVSLTFADSLTDAIEEGNRGAFRTFLKPFYRHGYAAADKAAIVPVEVLIKNARAGAFFRQICLQSIKMKYLPRELSLSLICTTKFFSLRRLAKDGYRVAVRENLI